MPLSDKYHAGQEVQYFLVLNCWHTIGYIPATIRRVGITYLHIEYVFNKVTYYKRTRPDSVK